MHAHLMLFIVSTMLGAQAFVIHCFFNLATFFLLLKLSLLLQPYALIISQILSTKPIHSALSDKLCMSVSTCPHSIVPHSVNSFPTIYFLLTPYFQHIYLCPCFALTACASITQDLQHNIHLFLHPYTAISQQASPNIYKLFISSHSVAHTCLHRILCISIYIQRSNPCYLFQCFPLPLLYRTTILYHIHVQFLSLIPPRNFVAEFFNTSCNPQQKLSFVNNS